MYKRQAHILPWSIIPDAVEWDELNTGERHEGMFYSLVTLCLLYTSDAADDLLCVALGGRRYIKKKKK